MPFFILANPRSGSSMFRLMLNAHSQITVPPESGFALWYAEKYSNKRCFDNEIYMQFIDDVIKAKKFETWKVCKEDLKEIICKLKPNSFVDLVNSVYKTYAQVNNKNSKIFGDKNNYYVNHVDEVIDYFPEEKLILLVRDGRDIAASYKKIDKQKIKSEYTPVLSKNIESIAYEWLGNVNKFIGLMDGNETSILVRYEDLLADPRSELTRVFNFLGEGFEEESLNFNDYNDEPIEFLQWKSKTLEKIDKSNMKKYKNELTKEEIEIFNSISNEQLVKLGYEV